MKRAIAFIVLFLNTVSLWGQITTPKTPQFTRPQAVFGTNATPFNPQYQSPRQTQIGANADDIRSRQYQVVVQKQQEVQQLMQQLQREIGNSSPSRFAANPERTKNFPAALQYLQQMLKGKLPLSVADAYYKVEEAYGDSYLSKVQYDSIINHSVVFIKRWMKQNGLDIKDNYMVHFAIKKFMSEHLTIQKTQSRGDKALAVNIETHMPFGYDYDDYQANIDHRNMFVTKCLATGYGQCASMPIVYLILAEKLGVKAYLSFAPQHSFVKHPNNSGVMINYEPTSNWEISDQWYRDNMFISAQAIKTGIYLDTLNSKQVVANCIFDLAVQYIKVDRTGKEDFILDCLRTGIPYFPENNNLPSLFIYGMHLKTRLRALMRKHNITNFDDLYKIPEAKALYTEFLGNEAYLTKLGYQDMPAGLYEDMLNEHKFKGDVQQAMKVNGKEKRNLFQQN